MYMKKLNKPIADIEFLNTSTKNNFHFLSLEVISNQ
jgi:hypothetical protein